MTKERAIDLCKAIDIYLCTGNPIWDVEEIHDAMSMAIEALKEKKTGKWIPGEELGRTMLGNCIIEIQYDGWTCSECHCLCEDSTKPTYKFCPNCGLRMENES